MISEWINWFNFLNPANHGDVIVIYPAEMGINRIPLWGFRWNLSPIFRTWIRGRISKDRLVWLSWFGFWYVLVEYGGVPISMLIHRTDINLLSGSSVWIFGKNNGNHSAGSLPKFSAVMHIHAMSQSQISNGLLCLRVLHHGMTPTFSFERWQGNPRWSWEASVTFWCAALKLRCLPLCPLCWCLALSPPKGHGFDGKNHPRCHDSTHGPPPCHLEPPPWPLAVVTGGGAFGATRQGLDRRGACHGGGHGGGCHGGGSSCCSGIDLRCRHRGGPRPALSAATPKQFPACSSLWRFFYPRIPHLQLGASAKSALWSTANLSAGLNSARLGQEAGASLENLTPFPSSPSRFTSKHTQKSWCVSSSTSTLVNIKNRWCSGSLSPQFNNQKSGDPGASACSSPHIYAAFTLQSNYYQNPKWKTMISMMHIFNYYQIILTTINYPMISLMFS